MQNKEEKEQNSVVSIENKTHQKCSRRHVRNCSHQCGQKQGNTNTHKKLEKTITSVVESWNVAKAHSALNRKKEKNVI